MSFPKVMVAVAAIIENNKGEILLIKRSPSLIEYPNCWEDVGGRLKQSEIPEDGLLREIKEETGLTDIEIVKPLTVFHIFRKGIKTAENELVGISYWCRTNSIEIKLSEEHIDYQWVSPEKAIKLTGHPALKNYIKLQIAEKALARKVNLLD